MKIKEIAFTSYAVSDVKKARDFYEGVLGLIPASVFEKGDMAFIEYEIGDHTLAIGKGAPLFSPSASGGVVAFEAIDFDALIKDLKKAKTKFLMEAHDTGVCSMAVVSDPAGNSIMIHKRRK